MSINVIGHITKDIVTTPNAKREMPGGTAFYFAKALGSLGEKVGVFSKMSKKDEALLEDLKKLPVSLHLFDSDSTTTFENIYSNDINIREQKIRAIANPFRWDEVNSAYADYIHLGPLTKHEITAELIGKISSLGKVSLDIQGLLRKISGTRIIYQDWNEKDRGLQSINILKANQREAEIITGKKEFRAAAKELAGHNVKEVVITLSEKGSIILFEDQFYNIPAFSPQKSVDTTGCGDTYMAGYIWTRNQGKDINYAGKFASAMASLKIEGFGGFSGTIKQVKARMKEL